MLQLVYRCMKYTKYQFNHKELAYIGQTHIAVVVFQETARNT